VYATDGLSVDADLNEGVFFLTRWFGLRAAFMAMFLALVAGMGCTTIPKMKTDIIGLPPETPPPDQHWNLPSALDLPQLGLEAGRPDYRVGHLDEIQIIVWGHSELGSQLLGESSARHSVVGGDGSVTLPFIRKVAVAGKTLEEISTLLHARYAEMIDDPQIMVRLERCRSQRVEVNGGIANPDNYYLCDNLLTIGELLGAAGAPTEDADPSRAVLSRKTEIYRLDLFKSLSGQTTGSEITLQAGDRLHIPLVRERMVFVFGEVLEQGAYPIPPGGMTLLTALSSAGGHNPLTAKVKEIYVARWSEDAPVVYRVDLGDVLQGPEVPLVAGDRIFVPPTNLARWGRWWRQAIPLGNFDRAIQRK
jgi:polysaccharide export outer membrane protein